MKPEDTTSLALRDARLHEELWRDGEWQQLWLSLQRRPWKSLAICPAGAGVKRDFAVTVAVVLARTGMLHLGAPIQVADATSVQLSDVVDLLAEVKTCSARGECVLVALAPLSESPVSLTLAQSTDYTLLCALLERMSSAQAKETVNKIGKERFLGTIVFRPDQLPSR